MLIFFVYRTINIITGPQKKLWGGDPYSYIFWVAEYEYDIKIGSSRENF